MVSEDLLRPSKILFRCINGFGFIAFFYSRDENENENEQEQEPDKKDIENKKHQPTSDTPLNSPNKGSLVIVKHSIRRK